MVLDDTICMTHNKTYQEELISELERWKYLATVDRLTAAKNLTALRLDIEERGWEQGFGAVFYIDLNGLKQINDLHGHEAGDTFIRSTALELSLCASMGGGTLYRVGGDEFIIVSWGEKHRLDILEGQLQVANVDGSFSYGRCDSTGVFSEDKRSGDRAMYQHKAEIKSGA